MRTCNGDVAPWIEHEVSWTCAQVLREDTESIKTESACKAVVRGIGSMLQIVAGTAACQVSCLCISSCTHGCKES